MRTKCLISFTMFWAFFSVMSVARAEVNVLAIGDSLTFGLYHTGQGRPPFNIDAHPYSIKLAELLNKHATVQWNVDTQGEPGELAKDMVSRLSDLLEASKVHYDYVIILAGTNDLGSGRSAQETFDSLKKMYMQVYRYGAKPVAITIPEIRFDKNDFESGYADDYSERRAATNFAIDAISQKGSFPLVDLEKYRDDFRDDANWDDGLHFSPQGYDKIGELLYHVLISVHTGSKFSAEKNVK